MTTATVERLLAAPPAPKPWWPDWRGATVLIAASGPSQRQEDLDHARGRCRVLAVNRTWELAPWADVLYSGDPRFWCSYDTSGFAGLKVAGAKTDTVVTVPDDFDGHFEDALDWLPKCARLHHSGAQAICYAAWWGAGRVILTGFDMRPGHWHGEHNTAPKSDYGDWIAGLAMLAPEIVAMGCEVINCTRETAIPEDVFRRANLSEVI